MKLSEISGSRPLESPEPNWSAFFPCAARISQLLDPSIHLSSKRPHPKPLLFESYPKIYSIAHKKEYLKSQASWLA